MTGAQKGSAILELSDGLAQEPLSEDIRDLYNAAHENILSNPEKAIELGQRALITLDRLSSIPLGDSNALVHARGRCHLLVGSVFLNRDQEPDLESAEIHFIDSREAFHSRQWSHLESLAYLGLAITLRKQNKFKEALIACKSAQDSVEHESIPSGVDTKELRKAINQERTTIQNALLSQEFAAESVQIPVVSDIAARLGLVTEESIVDYLDLREDERQEVDFGLEIINNSMTDQEIYPGDIALIRQQETVKNGEVAAVVIITPDMKPLGILRRYYVVSEKSEGLRHWLLEAGSPLSKHLVVIPSGVKVEEIRGLYTKKIPSKRVKFFENAELYVAGKYVRSISKKEKEEKEPAQPLDQTPSTSDDTTIYQQPKQ